MSRHSRPSRSTGQTRLSQWMTWLIPGFVASSSLLLSLSHPEGVSLDAYWYVFLSFLIAVLTLYRQALRHLPKDTPNLSVLSYQPALALCLTVSILIPSMLFICLVILLAEHPPTVCAVTPVPLVELMTVMLVMVAYSPHRRATPREACRLIWMSLLILIQPHATPSRHYPLRDPPLLTTVACRHAPLARAPPVT